MNPVTCRASDVLKYRTGYCFAKSHLLAALLRANQIPAGLCYQRLTIDHPPVQGSIDTNPPHTLHGLNAVLLPEFGWYRMDFSVWMSNAKRVANPAAVMPSGKKMRSYRF